MITRNITLSGKRKTSVAKASIKTGSGKITINKIPYTNFDFFNKLSIEEPVELTKQALGNFNFDIAITVHGGGSESRVEAARLAMARAIIEFTKNADLKKVFLRYDKNLLVADIRRKEHYKPGDSKARAKRQKSFR